ncbi:cobalamin biosynthesis protein CbiX, partial [Klebsiella pneumoniae]|nr:cobalamin biosynthesis protein CbiX [Klebsiella pneumoniae]
MSKALTPSQLKAEFAAEKDFLLKACLSALNQIPNQRIS